MTKLTLAALAVVALATPALAYDPIPQLLQQQINQDRMQFQQQQMWQQQRAMTDDMARFEDQLRQDRLPGEYQTDRLIGDLFDND